VTVPSGAGALAGVWASGLFDAWFVGAKGTILRWNGTALSMLTSPVTSDLTCVTGSADDDVWIGGQGGTLVHWDGTALTTYAAPGGRTINDVWKAFGADLLFVDDTGAIVQFVI
jgi:hypothetical protein